MTDASAPPLQPCPICGKPASRPHQPFCSKRCADIDLGRWLKGVYSVPTDEPAGEDEADSSAGRREVP